MSATGIQWSNDSGNAAAGCTEARMADGTTDPLCAHCYARLGSARMPGLMRGGDKPSERKEQIAKLYDGVAERAGRGARWTGVFRWDRKLLDDIFTDLRPWKRMFLGSQTDLWHKDHDPGLLVALAENIKRAEALSRASTGHLTFNRARAKGLIMLTKRADRQLAWQREHFPEGLPSWVWPGVSMGTRAGINERLDYLREVKARIRVVSAEPLLEEVDFSPWLERAGSCGACAFEGEPGNEQGTCPRCGKTEWTIRYGRFDRSALRPPFEWLIAGCESGHGRRPTDPAWLRSLRDQCAGVVPYFLKQMDVGGTVVGTPELDGRTWTEVPQ